MAWGLFKKIKNAVKKAAQWVRDRVIKPVINTVDKVIKSPTTKKLLDAGTKLAPLIAGAVGSAYGSPQAGLVAGNTIQNIGNSLGYGRY